MVAEEFAVTFWRMGEIWLAKGEPAVDKKM